MNRFRRSIAVGALMGAHVAFFMAGGATASAYSTRGISWSAKGSTYYVSNWYPTAFITAITSADAAWDNAGSSFRFSYGGTTTKNAGLPITGTSDGYNVIGYGNLGNTGYVALTGVLSSGSGIREVDTAINSTYFRFTTIGAAGSYDMQETMTHEFGHWLWLGDQYSSQSPYYCNSSSKATMCGVSVINDTYRRTLATDDKNGIKALYP